MGRNTSVGGRGRWCVGMPSQDCVGAIGGSSVCICGGRGCIGRHEDTGTRLGATLGACGQWDVEWGWSINGHQCHVWCVACGRGGIEPAMCEGAGTGGGEGKAGSAATSHTLNTSEVGQRAGAMAEFELGKLASKRAVRDMVHACTDNEYITLPPPPPPPNTFVWCGGTLPTFNF